MPFITHGKSIKILQAPQNFWTGSVSPPRRQNWEQACVYKDITDRVQHMYMACEACYTNLCRTLRRAIRRDPLDPHAFWLVATDANPSTAIRRW